MLKAGFASLGMVATLLFGPGSDLSRSVASAAPPAPLWETCKAGSGAGQCVIPRGVAANPSDGHVFVADQENRRIEEFTAWGEFIKAWGWDVVASGPDDDTTAPEDQFEICIPKTGDVCKAGISGSGAGQFSSPQGLALDSSGNVYVVDLFNARVQKFDPEGHFLLMFGGKVNKTKVEAAAPEAEQNLCTAASGNVCQAGVEGTGNGQFGAWPITGGSFISITPDDKVYVGDQNRIQRFDTGGVYQSQIAIPGETVKSLATDTSGNLYVDYIISLLGFHDKPDVHKLSPSGAPIAPETFPVPDPRAIATDAAGNVYVFNAASTEILQFDSAGNLKEKFAGDLNAESTGIATNICSGSAAPGSVYVTNVGPSFLRAYGSPPVGCEPPPPVPPEIKAQYAVSVGTDAALLRAQVNPNFFDDATYFVEYGTGDCALNACTERAPLGAEAKLGGGVTNADLTTAGVFLADLSPETTYHYRFVTKSGGGGPVFGIDPDGEGAKVASPSEGLEATFTTPPLPAQPKTDCPNQIFRTGASSFLPDCRAFEMVTPIDKNGSGIETFTASGSNVVPAALVQSAGSGAGITYSSKQAFGDALAGPYSSQYLSRRDPSQGWSTHSLSPPQEDFPGLERQAFDTEFKAFSEDLSQAWLIHDAEPPLAPCAPANSPDLYRRDNLTDSYEALHCKPNNQLFKGWESIELQGVSSDGCRAVFRANSKLTEDAQAGFYQLYESSCEGSLRLISRLPDKTACAEDSSAGSSLAGLPGAFPDGRTKSVWHAFTSDAHRLYWSCGSTIYLRTDPDLNAVGEPGEESVKVLAPTSAIAPAPRFQMASPDGARALLTSTTPAGVFRLQAYDAASGKLSVPAIATGLEDSHGERVDLLGASEDATRAYLVSNLVLIPQGTKGAENSEKDEAQAGQPNLYLYQAGGGGSLTFVGTLSAGDLHREPITPSPVHPLRFRRASRVSPDGLHAAFISAAPLTHYDNTDANSGEADAEVFVFDASANGGAGKLLCVSCNPTGARPSGRNIAITGEESSSARFWGAAQIPGWPSQLYQGRPLSEDGRRLFFDSFEALVTRDTNNRQDVYEWEQAGSGGECQELGAELYVASADGCLSLISSGQDPEDSEFVDADRDGSDVFIKTGQSLLVQDPGLTDIYDARIQGGFPPPPAPQPECEGEACQNPPGPPAFGTPASSSFSGSPNPKHKAKKHHKKHHKRHRKAHPKQGRAAR